MFLFLIQHRSACPVSFNDALSTYTPFHIFLRLPCQLFFPHRLFRSLTITFCCKYSFHMFLGSGNSTFITCPEASLNFFNLPCFNILSLVLFTSSLYIHYTSLHVFWFPSAKTCDKLIIANATFESVLSLLQAIWNLLLLLL